MTLSEAREGSTFETLTYARIFRFYFPLALSWIFMAVESPIAVAVLSRLPEPQVHTAAFFAAMSLALWIESPVIDLLATSTTLAKNRQHYTVLTKFVGWLLIGVTLAHAIIVFTPLYDFVAHRLLMLPSGVAESTRLGLGIMLFWSAFIGWRRYLQGVLIRNGYTRRIGIGTGLRVVTMAGTSFGLFLFADLPGIAIVAIGLIASVAAECFYIHAATRPIVRKHFFAEGPQQREHSSPLTNARLTRFHFPLTATTMVMMASLPVTAAALDRTSNPTLMLASWQVAISLLFLMRTIVFALPEVVITLARDTASARKLREFCAYVGAAASIALILLAATGLDVLFFKRVLGAGEDVADMAHVGFAMGALTPFLGALQSYVRGMLTAHHLTTARLWSILIGMVTLAGMLALGLALQWPGVVNAAMALTVAMALELATLAVFWRKAKHALVVSS